MKGGEKVCKGCRRFIVGNVCPVCNTAEFTKSWKGVVFIGNPNESEVAKLLTLRASGKYALWIK